MADLSITAANVLKVSGQTSQGVAGATITQGQPVYLDTNSKLQLGFADTAVHALATGIALTAGSANQPIVYVTSGQINLGATLVAGEIYMVSQNNAGGIMPVGDYVAGNYGFVLGMASSTSQMTMIMADSIPQVAHG